MLVTQLAFSWPQRLSSSLLAIVLVIVVNWKLLRIVNSSFTLLLHSRFLTDSSQPMWIVIVLIFNIATTSSQINTTSDRDRCISMYVQSVLLVVTNSVAHIQTFNRNNHWWQSIHWLKEHFILKIIVTANSPPITTCGFLELVKN